MTGSQKAIKIISIILIVVGIVALIAGLLTFAGGIALVGAGAEASSIDQQFYVSSAGLFFCSWCWCTYQWGYRSTHWYFWVARSKRSSKNWTFLCVFDNWFGAFYS